MSSNIKIRRICDHCKQEFIARTSVTKYCSRECNSRAYKAKVREAKIQKSNIEFQREGKGQTITPAPSTSFEIKTLDYLTVLEAANLLKCGKRTIYRLIDTGRLRATNLSIRRTRILKQDIDALFKITDQSVIPIDERKFDPDKIQLKNCLTINQILSEYNISDSSFRVLCFKNNVPKFQKGKFVYIPKYIIEPILKKYRDK